MHSNRTFLVILVTSFSIAACASKGVLTQKEQAQKEQVEVATPAEPSADELLNDIKTKLNGFESELAQAKKQLRKQKKTRVQLKKELKTISARVAAEKKKSKATLSQLDKANADIKKLKTLKDEQLVQKAKYDDEAGKLEKLKAEGEKTTSSIQPQLDKVNAENKSMQDKTAALESEIRQKRKRLEMLNEQLQEADSDAKIADGDLKDTQDRLKEMTARLNAKEAEFNQHQKAADKRSRARDVAEAKIAMDTARAEQSLNRMPASDNVPVTVDLHRQKTANGGH